MLKKVYKSNSKGRKSREIAIALEIALEKKEWREKIEAVLFLYFFLIFFWAANGVCFVVALVFLSPPPMCSTIYFIMDAYSCPMYIWCMSSDACGCCKTAKTTKNKKLWSSARSCLQLNRVVPPQYGDRSECGYVVYCCLFLTWRIHWRSCTIIVVVFHI